MKWKTPHRVPIFVTRLLLFSFVSASVRAGVAPECLSLFVLDQDHWQSLRGRYEISFPFATGYWATVHRGRMPVHPSGLVFPQIGRPGEWVVIKVPLGRRDTTLDPQAAGAIQHESAMLARLFRVETRRGSHLFVRGILDRESNALIMEDIKEGRTLQEWSNDPSSSPTRAQIDSIVSQLNQAIQLLHEAGMVHGDLNPNNILIRPDGSILIIDFGLAADVGAHPPHHRGQRFGTDGYISPNQVRNGPAQFADDEFAVAAVRQWLMEYWRNWGQP